MFISSPILANATTIRGKSVSRGQRRHQYSRVDVGTDTPTPYPSPTREKYLRSLVVCDGVEEFVRPLLVSFLARHYVEWGLGDVHPCFDLYKSPSPPVVIVLFGGFENDTLIEQFTITERNIYGR